MQIELEQDAIGYAANKLNEGWLIVWAPMPGFAVRTSKNGTSGLILASWAQTVRSIFEMRRLEGIEEQIRRLNIPSHEALDTDLVIRIAGKYHRSGFNVAFEPNGDGCSDLLIEDLGFRSYAEIKKREPVGP